MSRPLLVTDCDEVLLHFVRHFGEWLDEVHGMPFRLDGNPFAQDLTPRGSRLRCSQKAEIASNKPERRPFTWVPPWAVGMRLT